jgi:hypothetical protein
MRLQNTPIYIVSTFNFNPYNRQQEAYTTYKIDQSIYFYFSLCSLVRNKKGGHAIESGGQERRQALSKHIS